MRGVACSLLHGLPQAHPHGVGVHPPGAGALRHVGGAPHSAGPSPFCGIALPLHRVRPTSTTSDATSVPSRLHASGVGAAEPGAEAEGEATPESKMAWLVSTGSQARHQRSHL